MIDDHRVDIAVVSRLIESDDKLRIYTLKTCAVVCAGKRDAVCTGERNSVCTGERNAVRTDDGNAVGACEGYARWICVVEKDSRRSEARGRIGSG